MSEAVLSAYGIKTEGLSTTPYGSGLINCTWLVATQESRYILQKINTTVFKNPQAIASNIRLLKNHIRLYHPECRLVAPITALHGEDLVQTEDGYFRLFPFVEDTHTVDVAQSPEQAREAARAFGKFTRCFSGFPAESLSITLPDFHNLPLRYAQFEKAIRSAGEERLEKAGEMLEYLQQQKGIVEASERIQSEQLCPPRVIHHDTKISNVLFDKANKSVCVIDLDTVMPGFFISDVGDMLRTYLSPVSEEETDLAKIHVREEYFRAIAEGYLSEMKDVLTAAEKKLFTYSGRFMIYMQALRFVTDYLNHDIYYETRYEDHNLKRAQNQSVLLAQLTAREREFNQWLESVLA